MKLGRKNNPIDITNLQKVFNTSVNRAAWFTAIYLNKAESIKRVDLLSPQSSVQFSVPESVDLEKTKSNFQQWAFLNGLREIFEGLEHTLNIVYEWLLRLRIIEDGISVGEAQTAHRSFLGQGVSVKLDRLSTEYSIVDTGFSKIKSITKARNCITHRRGVVGNKDINPDTKLMSLTWEYIRLFALLDDGSEIDVVPGTVFSGPRKIMASIQEKEKTFNLSERLVLSIDELNEMIFTIKIEGQKIITSVQKVFTDSAKVNIINPK